MHGSSPDRNWEVPGSATSKGEVVRATNPKRNTVVMHEPGKSDRPIVPKKPPNKGRGTALPAEGAEGRGLAKGNPPLQNQPIGLRAAPGWQSALERIRQAKKRLRVRTQGKSRMRQSLTYGSVRGASGNRRPYRDNPG